MVQVVVCFLIVAGQLRPVSSPQAHRAVAPRPLHPKLFHHAVDGRACLFVRVEGASWKFGPRRFEVDRVFGPYLQIWNGPRRPPLAPLKFFFIKLFGDPSPSVASMRQEFTTFWSFLLEVSDWSVGAVPGRSDLRRR